MMKMVINANASEDKILNLVDKYAKDNLKIRSRLTLVGRRFSPITVESSEDGVTKVNIPVDTRYADPTQEQLYAVAKGVAYGLKGSNREVSVYFEK